MCNVLTSLLFSLGSTQLDSMDVDDPKVEQAMLSKTTHEVSISEALEKAGLNELGTSKKDASSNVGCKKPAT